MPSLPLPNSRILVATAVTQFASHLNRILSGLRYSVQIVDESSEALKILLGSNPPDVALLHADLPGHGGLELAAEVKRRPGKKQTWIMLLSSIADPAAVTAAADAGADDLLLSAVGDPAGESVSEFDLRVRLNVARRVQEITRELEAQMEAVSFNSLHDSLTGLWNRESLLSLLFLETDRVQRMGTSLGLLLLDLDHFKSVNAGHGYEVGDKILEEFATRLRRYLRSYDLIGRCGEDEFLVALPGCNSRQALHLAERIRTKLLNRPFAAGGDTITITASIGVAQSRGRSPLVVLREAERALTTAKHEGRNCEREYIAPQPENEQSEKAACLI
jgi:two-component system, cell cycle response regulator